MLTKIKTPFFLGTLLFIGLFFFLPHVDTDFGWHLRYGEHFLQTKTVLRTNELTYYLAGYLWPNSYTLYQIIITTIYKISGFLGISIAYSALMVSTYIVYNKLNPKLIRVNLITFIFIIIFGFSVFASGFRAQIFTFVFLVSTLYLLKYFFDKKYLPIIFVLIYILWANLHGGFILGLILIASAFINAVLSSNKRGAFLFGISLVFSTLASLINPYGIKIFLEDIRHMQVPMGTLIAEWVAPSFFYKLIIVISSLIILFQIWKIKSKKIYFWTFLVTGLSYITLLANRNLPFYAMVTLQAAYEVFHKRLLIFENNLTIKTLTNILLLSGIGITALVNIPKTLTAANNPEYICRNGILPTPCKAVEFIKKSEIPGKNVFSSYEWGGFLAWKLPEYKFFVDGRTPAWPTPDGKSPYTVYLEIIQAQKGYQESLDKYGTDWMLVPANTFLDLELQTNQTVWKEIYRDEISVVYVKT